MRRSNSSTSTPTTGASPSVRAAPSRQTTKSDSIDSYLSLPQTTSSQTSVDPDEREQESKPAESAARSSSEEYESEDGTARQDSGGRNPLDKLRDLETTLPHVSTPKQAVADQGEDNGDAGVVLVASPTSEGEEGFP